MIITPRSHDAYLFQDLGNMSYYLLDDNCFDQFSIIYDGGTTTAIYLNAVPEAIEVAKREVSGNACIRS